MAEKEREELVSVEAIDHILTHNQQQILFVDIETGPVRESILKNLFDEDSIELPEPPGKFNPTEVKVGNITNPVKIQEKIDRVRKAHRHYEQKYPTICEEIKQKAWDKFVEDAAKDPLTGQVVAVGYGILRNGKLFICLDIADEKSLLLNFWNFEVNIKRMVGKILTFNGDNFDIPFLTKRSWAHNIDCPYRITSYNRLEDHYKDLMKHWGMGNSKKFISLGQLAKFLGVKGKFEEMDGADFHRVLQEDREKALEYLKCDITALKNVACRMGVV